jgi:membrane peptidoglycan carboxypeptidase
VGFNHPAGAKTGTTNDFRDAWFTGYTRQYSTSVWVGFDDNNPMIGPNGKGLTGAHAAAPIWGMFLKRVLKNVERQDFELPEEVRYEQVNFHNGFFSPDQSKDTIRVALHSGAALPVRPTRIVQENVKKINFNQTGSLRQPQDFALSIDRSFDRVEGRPLAVTPTKQVKFDSAQLETQIWYVLNLDNASLGQGKRTSTSLLMNFLTNTKELATNGENRLNQARKTAIEHIYQSLGSLYEKSGHGPSLKNVMTQSEIIGFNRSQ